MADVKYFIVESTSRNPNNYGARYDVVPMRSIDKYAGRTILASDMELDDAFNKVKELESEKKPGELF